MTSTSVLLPFQPATMSKAQLAAVSFLARCAGHTHDPYTFQPRQWFAWCEANGLDPARDPASPRRGCTSATSPGGA
ncbi:hypothetical protein [Terrabacter sp. RAF57]|uniref:hypothetical protein n=1 Tax=Terrabacter sp. RAF57 TaxID=3233063 RepID=UPI003F9B9249